VKAPAVGAFAIFMRRSESVQSSRGKNHNNII